MPNVIDRDELAAQLKRTIEDAASNRMPSPVLISVYDASMQYQNGTVWAKHGDRNVQCLAPGAVNLRSATPTAPMVIWAFPPNPDEPGAYYIYVGFAYNGVTTTRFPPVVASSFETGDGTSIDGTVTSVALSAAPASVFGVSGSPVTGAGTLALTMDNQAANTTLSGPTTGAAAAPEFRTLVSDDIPSVASTKISDFAEAVDDRVAALLVAGANITLTYNDGAGTLTIAAVGGGDELLGFFGMAI